MKTNRPYHRFLRSLLLVLTGVAVFLISIESRPGATDPASAATPTEPTSVVSDTTSTSTIEAPVAVPETTTATTQLAASTSTSATTTPSAPPAGTTIITISTAAGSRSAVVHIPVLPGDKAVPLVIALHGSSSSGAALESITGLDAIADANGFIVAYPDGALIGGERSWNSGGCCDPATSAGVNDVAFLSDALKQLLRTYPIDPSQVFVVGHSNGAIMAQVVACQMADQIAAVASVSGALDADLPCHPTRPVSMLELHGTADTFVDYAYGQQAVASWRSFDGCALASSTTSQVPFTLTTWSTCRDGSTVELVTNDGGPHDWPATGSAMVWAFLSTHLNDNAA